MKEKVIRARVSEKFLKRVDSEAENRGMGRSDFVRFALESQLPKPKEVIIMTREEMINELKGKTFEGRLYYL